MTTSRNKKQLAAVDRDGQEEHTKETMPTDKNTPRVDEEQISQISEENESKVVENVSHDFA